MSEEAERRLREREEALRAEADERVRAETEAIRTEMERKAEEQIAALRAQLEEEAEAKHLDALVAAKAAAAEWLRGQKQRLLRNAEKRASAAERRQAMPAPVPHEPDTEEQSAAEPVETASATVESEPKMQAAAQPGAAVPLDINKASFQQLRDVGLSVTQATRVIAYRERQEGFASIDDLESVPGFSKRFLAGVRDRLTA